MQKLLIVSLTVLVGLISEERKDDAMTSYDVRVAGSEEALVAGLGGWLASLVAAAPQRKLSLAVSGGSMVGLLGKVFVWAKVSSVVVFGMNSR